MTRRPRAHAAVWPAIAKADGATAAMTALRQHPGLAQSVRGTVQQQGAPFSPAPDDGKNINAPWIGQRAQGSCGKEIRGTWNNVQHHTTVPFGLRKQSGWQ
ncbi:hypothetical protein [Acidovorax sp. SUPP3334]|uniref:hypothetical protein n=1 Tax=Acidovorax sp. SUPP3334 TaxID=2920881 RepID=UPI0023DE4129|nr:hypothetical protein [Acidovorax sp. SUPP3334]GKT25436.1 hypothetical protein AVHM3334_17940 [Acidovorax sp. SUPP3334]